VVDPDGGEARKPVVAPGDDATAAVESDLAVRTRYRELRAKLLSDPEVKAAQEAAETATVEETKREAFRKYYFVLFDKLRAEDPSIREYLNRMEAAYLRRLERRRFVEGGPDPEP